MKMFKIISTTISVAALSIAAASIPNSHTSHSTNISVHHSSSLENAGYIDFSRLNSSENSKSANISNGGQMGRNSHDRSSFEIKSNINQGQLEVDVVAEEIPIPLGQIDLNVEYKDSKLGGQVDFTPKSIRGLDSTNFSIGFNAKDKQPTATFGLNGQTKNGLKFGSEVKFDWENINKSKISFSIKGKF